MPELDGLQVIERVRAVDPDVVIAVITGYATIATAVDAMKAGAYDFLPKPFTPDELRLIVNRGHERWRLAMESQRLRREKEEAERRFVTFVSHQLKSPLVAAKQYLDVLLFTVEGRDDAEDARVALARAGPARRDADPDPGLADAGPHRARHALASRTPRRILRLSSRQRSETAEATGPGGRRHASRPSSVRTSASCAGDAVSLGTIVSNLVSNAIKYNRAGGTRHGARVARRRHARCSR